MRHLRIFESFSINEEEFINISKMISDYASPYMDKAKQVLKQILEENPDVAAKIEDTITSANISAEEQEKAMQLLQADPTEVEQAVEEVSPELVSERFSSKRYGRSRLINESILNKITTVIGGILQWFGIGTIVYKISMVVWALITGAGVEILAAAASGAMIGMLAALAIIVVGMIIARKSPFEVLGISHDKLPRGFKH